MMSRTRKEGPVHYRSNTATISLELMLDFQSPRHDLETRLHPDFPAELKQVSQP